MLIPAIGHAYSTHSQMQAKHCVCVYTYINIYVYVKINLKSFLVYLNCTFTQFLKKLVTVETREMSQ